MFLPVDVHPTVQSPLGSGSAVVVGKWQHNRSSLAATMFFAAAYSDVLMQPKMADLPIIWAPAAVVTLFAVPLPQPSVSACSSPLGGVWGSAHWQLNLTLGGGGSLTGDCSILSVTAAVLVGGADPKLLVVSGELQIDAVCCCSLH